MTVAGDDPAAPPRARRRPGDVAAPALGAAGVARAVVVVLVAILVVRITLRAGTVLPSVTLAAVLAFLTEPARRRLARHLPGGVAAALVAVGTFAGLVALAAVVVRDLGAQATRLDGALVGALDRLRAGSVPAQLAGAVGAADAVHAVLSRLAPAVVTGAGTPAGMGRRAADAFLVVVLAAFAQTGAPAALDAVAARWPRPARAEVRAWWATVGREAGAVVRRSLLLACGVGAAVGAAAAALGVPGPVVLAVWAGVWSAVPAVGSVVAAVPFVATAAAVSPRTGAMAVVTVAVVGAAAVVVRRRAVDRGAGRLTAPLWVLALGVGTHVGGGAGGLVGVTVLALLVAAARARHDLPWPPGKRADRTADVVRIEAGRPVLLPSWRGAAVVLLACVAGASAWLMVRGASGAVAWLVIGAFAAVALDRPAAALVRRLRLPRPVAGWLVLIATATALGGLMALGVRGAATSGGLADLPERLRGLERAPLVGGLARRFDAAGRLADAVRSASQGLGDRGLEEWLPRLGGTVVELGWAIVLAAALVLEGRRTLRALPELVPARHRRQVARLGEVALGALGAYVAGAVAVAALNAAFVFVVALALGVVVAPLLAAWAFVWNFVPQVGGFMGGAPLVLFALAAGPGRALVAALAFITYQFTENHLIQPAVVAQAVDVPAWATLLAALAGGAAAGALGAVVLTPLVGVVHHVAAAARRPDFPGRTVDAAPG